MTPCPGFLGTDLWGKGLFLMRSFKRAILFVLLILNVVFLFSCKKNAEIGTFYSNGAYENKNTGIRYLPAPDCYEAIERGAEYSRVDLGSDKVMILYEIVGLSPEKWLVGEDGSVFHAENVQPRGLSSLMVSKIHLSYDSRESYIYATIEDGAEIAEILGEYLISANVTYNGSTPSRVIIMRFESNDMPGLYYTASYLEYSADVVIYDPITKISVDLSNPEDESSEKDIDENLEGKFNNGDFDKSGHKAVKIDKFVYDEKYEPDEKGSYYLNNGKYTLIEDETLLKPGSERYSLVSYSVEWSAVYNLGKYFYYDRPNKKMVPASDYIHSLS